VLLLQGKHFLVILQCAIILTTLLENFSDVCKSDGDVRIAWLEDRQFHLQALVVRLESRIQVPSLIVEIAQFVESYGQLFVRYAYDARSRDDREEMRPLGNAYD